VVEQEELLRLLPRLIRRELDPALPGQVLDGEIGTDGTAKALADVAVHRARPVVNGRLHQFLRGPLSLPPGRLLRPPRLRLSQ